MSGMDATTGRRLDDVAHIRQSIKNILTTRIGSRVMRRDYGSLLPELIDHPTNPVNQLRLMAATVMAVTRWEPRVKLTRVLFSVDAGGRAVVAMDAVLRTGRRTGHGFSVAVNL